MEHRGRFNGYTNFWQTSAWNWHQHGNLFLIGQPDVAKAIAQNKADIAEELGLPGLVLDEGFLEAWLRSTPAETLDPDAGVLSGALEGGDVLVWLEREDPLGRKLLEKAPRAAPTGRLSAAISSGAGFPRAEPRSRSGGRSPPVRGRRPTAPEAGPIQGAPRGGPGHPRPLRPPPRLVRRRDAAPQRHLPSRPSARGHRAGARPGQRLVHVRRLHGLHACGRSSPAWLGKVGLGDVAVDVGTGKASHSLGSVAYGLRSYDGLKIQDMPTEEEWIRFVKDRGRPCLPAGLRAGMRQIRL